MRKLTQEEWLLLLIMALILALIASNLPDVRSKHTVPEEVMIGGQFK